VSSRREMRPSESESHVKIRNEEFSRCKTQNSGERIWREVYRNPRKSIEENRSEVGDECTPDLGRTNWGNVASEEEAKRKKSSLKRGLPPKGGTSLSRSIRRANKKKVIRSGYCKRSTGLERPEPIKKKKDGDGSGREQQQSRMKAISGVVKNPNVSHVHQSVCFG